MELKGKRALVTGGVKGIGRGVVERMLREEADVCVFDVDPEGLERLKQEHPGVCCIECDITDYGQVVDSLDRCYTKMQWLDILVNNAGILFSLPLIGLSAEGIRKHDVDAWNRVISADLSSVFYVTVNVVERMVKERTRGVIVNISSVSASGVSGQSAYSAAKAGVNALTAVWAKELGPFGIRVAGVAPGYTETPSTRAAMTDSTLKEVLREVPLRRLGKVDEIAESIISVIRNGFFHGKILEIDGGLVV